MPTMPNEITIYCNAVKGHPKKRREVVIQSFVRRSGMDDMPGRGWTDVNKSPRLQHEKVHLSNGRALIGNDPYRQSEMKGEQARESFSFTCRFCGTTVAIRGEKLYDALDTLREYGVPRIELGAFAATMSNMTSK